MTSVLRRLLLLAPVAWLIVGASPAGAKPPLDYHDPPPDRLVGPGPFVRLPVIDDNKWVVLEVRDQPYWKAGKSDAVLTNACRLGEFVSLPANRMVVRFVADEGRGLLHVVLPTHRHLLFDQRRLVRPNETYYFHDPGLPTCEVWFGGKRQPRVLDPVRGTSLPPLDPRAVQKKKALINSWPKN